MQYARGEPGIKCPTLLTYAFQCKNWGALPNAGGIRDQPAGMLSKMSTLYTIYTATKGYLSAKSTAVWAENNPDAWERYAMARTLEIESNGN